MMLWRENPDDTGEQPPLTMRNLIERASRLGPSRLIIDEIRSPAVAAALWAVSSGHDGSVASAHGRTINEALTRLAAAVQLDEAVVSDGFARQMIASTTAVIVRTQRDTDSGQPHVVEIVEITAAGEGTIFPMPIFQVRDGDLVSVAAT